MPINRRTAVSTILKSRDKCLVVASLGNPTYDVAAAGDSPLNFYLWGAMGGAVMVGFGLALSRPRRRVVVFVGDGELMMSLGALATVAIERPANLAVVVIDNQHYAETGMQLTHTGRGVDLAAVAAAVGFPITRVITRDAELPSAAETILEAPGPAFVALKVGTEPNPACLPPRDGPYLRSRFMEALLGQRAQS